MIPSPPPTLLRHSVEIRAAGLALLSHFPSLESWRRWRRMEVRRDLPSMTQRATRQPRDDDVGDGETDGDEGGVIVALRPRSSARRAEGRTRPRGEEGTR